MLQCVFPIALPNSCQNYAVKCWCNEGLPEGRMDRVLTLHTVLRKCLASPNPIPKYLVRMVFLMLWNKPHLKGPSMNWVLYVGRIEYYMWGLLHGMECTQNTMYKVLINGWLLFHAGGLPVTLLSRSDSNDSISRWGNDPTWRAYFSDGLKPPTRYEWPTLVTI